MEAFIQVGLQIILLICIIYIMFFKDYIKRKGSNLADKQDIANITQKVELVKNEFTRENEFLKANLQFIISNQLQQSNEERNAIINFFDNFSRWLNVGLLDTRVTDYNRNNIDNLIQKDRDLNDFYTQTNVAQNRISLLVDNSEIVKLSRELIAGALKFNHWTQNHLMELRFNLESDKRGAERFLGLMKIRPIPDEAYNIAQEEKKLQADKKAICDDYYKNKIQEYQNVLNISTKFTDVIKVYLKKIQEN